MSHAKRSGLRLTLFVLSATLALRAVGTSAEIPGVLGIRERIAAVNAVPHVVQVCG